MGTGGVGCTLHLLKAAANLALTGLQALPVSPAEVWPVLTLSLPVLEFCHQTPVQRVSPQTSPVDVTLNWWLFVVQHVRIRDGCSGCSNPMVAVARLHQHVLSMPASVETNKTISKGSKYHKQQHKPSAATQWL